MIFLVSTSSTVVTTTKRLATTKVRRIRSGRMRNWWHIHGIISHVFILIFGHLYAWICTCWICFHIRSDHITRIQGLRWVSSSAGRQFGVLNTVGFRGTSEIENLEYRPGQPNWEYSMWKFQDFSATQILREIIFGHFEAPKTTILTS